MRKVLLITLLLTGCGVGTGYAPVVDSTTPTYWLVMGQSNLEIEKDWTDQAPDYDVTADRYIWDSGANFEDLSLNEAPNLSWAGGEFGKALYDLLDRPVHLYTGAIGGTEIECWFPGASCYQDVEHYLDKQPADGVLWWQGEQNAFNGMRGQTYEALLRAMINEWRGDFGYDLPFVIVVLETYSPLANDRGDSDVEPDNWQEIREAQVRVCQTMTKVRCVSAQYLNVDPVEGLHITDHYEEVGGLAAEAALELLSEDSLRPTDIP